MQVDVLTARVNELVREYRVTRDRDTIFGREADQEAAALWIAVRAIDPGTAPRWLDARLTEANAALGWLHYWRYRESTEPQQHAELARAVLCLEPASDIAYTVPEDLEPVVGRFADSAAQAELALALLRASASSQDPALLDAGIGLMTPAAAALPNPDPGRGTRLSYLCLAHRRRYERDGDRADLDQAVSAGEEAVAIMDRHGAQAVEPWSNLAAAYWSRYRLHGSLDDLQRVIGLFERVLALAGPGETLLSDLATTYRQYYEHTGEIANIERAVALAEQAAELSGDLASTSGRVNPEVLAILASLSNALLRRYERAGTEPDLRKAAELAERIVSSLPPDDPQRSIRLADAASVLLRHYERSRVVADVNRAVDLNEQALSLLPEEDPHRPDILISFAATLHQRYLCTGAGNDLDRAAMLSAWALAAIPAGDARRPRASAERAVIYATRFARTGVLGDINQAIELAEQIITSTTAFRPEWLTMLSRAYQQRYAATRTVADLDRAIDFGERSLALTEENYFALAGRRAGLAAAHWRRYEQWASKADLDRAIDLGELAVSATPDDHVDRPERMSSLGATLLARYRLERMPADLKAAIDLSEGARSHVPAGHPSLPRLTAGLCTAYLERITAGAGAPDPENLDELGRAVAEARAVAPADRVSAHHAVGALALAAGHPALASAMLDSALTLLPSVAPREAGWADQQHRIGEHFGLVETAVAAHCAAGDPAGAVEIAELGRGVLLASQANTRADLADLDNRNTRLAARFRWVCERLNTPDFPADERKRWWADYDTLLANIRELPGFSDFLAAPRLADLRPAAAGGCVVLVNASSYRSDAVVVRADSDPVSIELPGLRLADVETKVEALLQAYDETYSLAIGRRRRQVTSSILSWLWDAAAAPVIDTLRCPGTETCRVWWLPTGLLGLLPLHAAGHIGQPGALDAVVSSFVPSFRALREARTRPPARNRNSLTVAVHSVPGLPELSAAASEAAALSDSALLDDTATADRVLVALNEATWAHFACHAVADPATQADSGLRLHDRMLRLPEIGGLRLREAELAYLSACSTANHGTRYADEVLHLASAFQLAGFRHVIASLWQLDDDTAAEAARSFYRELPHTPVADDAAAVLRRVTLRLRDQHPDRPELWAPLIHSGP